MKKKMAKTIGLALSLSMLGSFAAFAGEWQKNETGWWYQNDDGTYPVNTWQWIDGNHDGIAESYYFDPNGYCLQNTTTPDGYMVNADGAWIENGVVQTNGTNQQTASQTLGKTKPALELNTDFIKQEFVDVLGESREYALERLADYGAEEKPSLDWPDVVCYSKVDGSPITISYTRDNMAWSITSTSMDIFDTTETSFDLNEKLGSYGMQLSTGAIQWYLIGSPYTASYLSRYVTLTCTLGKNSRIQINYVEK